MHENESGNVLEHQKDEKSRTLQGMFTLLNINHMMDLPVVRKPGGSMDPVLDIDIRDALWQIRTAYEM